MKECENCQKDKELEKILYEYKEDKDNLIQILNDIQERYGFISTAAQMRVAEYLSIPFAEVYGVVTFYSRFTLKPKGKYNIAVCLGTACYVKGSEKILDRLKEIGNKCGRNNRRPESFQLRKQGALVHVV